MVRCDLDGFLSQLHKLYERNKASGTVWVTMKRSALRRGPRASPSSPRAPRAECKRAPPPPKPQPPIRDDECVCLVRATDGKRKISAEVGPAQLAKFKASYQLLLRAHAGEGLKKREKKGAGAAGAAGRSKAGGGGAAKSAAAGAGGAAGGSGGKAGAAAKKAGSSGGKK